MNLTFNNIVPLKVLKDDLVKSDVWNSKIIFEKGNNYLIRSVSGKGKSTLISFLSGCRNDFSGKFFMNEFYTKDLSKENWIELRKNKIALVNQDLKLMSNITVLENLLLKNDLTNHTKIENIESLLNNLNIINLKDKKCGHLSMGQQQRVAIIRSLLQPFTWILLDEPFSHLDKKNKLLAIELIIKVTKENKAGIILTTLDINENLDSFKSINL